MSNGHRPCITHSPGTNDKVDTQIQHFVPYWRSLLNVTDTNWAPLAPKPASAHNTSINYITGKAPYASVLGTKPQIHVSVNMGHSRNM